MMADEEKQENFETAVESNCQQPENSVSADEILRSRVDKESVIGFIEGMMQAMGTAAMGTMPQPLMQRPAPSAQSRKFQSKTVGAIMQKLERLQKYPDLAREVQEDPLILEWLSRSGCKKTDYYEELECAQELTSFYGGYRRFDMAIQSAAKALNMTTLHRRDDEETVAELNWVLADLHAANDQMDKALEYLSVCLSLLEPGADQEHPTYKELLNELKTTNQRSKAVVTA